jgi:hypothetical protein
MEIEFEMAMESMTTEIERINGDERGAHRCDQLLIEMYVHRNRRIIFH